jgi:hypothetical protein
MAGRFRVLTTPLSRVFSGVCYAFDTDHWLPSGEHESKLRQYVLPILRPGGAGVTLQGRATPLWRGRVGERKPYNLQLSQRRVNAVYDLLDQMCNVPFACRKYAVGMEPALREGEPLGSDDAWYRAVVVTAWPRPQPPPPPPLPDPPPQEPGRTTVFSIRMSSGNEVVGPFTVQEYVFEIRDERRIGVYGYSGRGVGSRDPFAPRRRTRTDFGAGPWRPLILSSELTRSPLDFGGFARLVSSGGRGPGGGMLMLTLEDHFATSPRGNFTVNFEAGTHENDDRGFSIPIPTTGTLRLLRDRSRN